ncbi:MAG: hypothetical protein KJZ65_06735 [Phycisphaerales bacterium]|nr:hypothetical protein [Phycisphaerales bacterium]
MIGAGFVLGTFSARLGLDTSQYSAGIINADTMNRVFGQSFSAFVANPLLGSIDLIKKVGAGFLDLSNTILGNAEAVQRLSQQTGASVEVIQALEKRLDIAGFAAERARQALIKLNQQAGMGSKVFEQLGIDPAQARSIDSLLGQVLDGLTAVEDQTTRTALAMQLFGEEAGPQLLNAVGGGSEALRAMIAEYRDLGLVINQSGIQTLANFNTTIGYSKQAIDGLKQTAVAGFLKGFAGEFDTGTGSIREFTGELTQRLGPAAENFGTKLGSAVGNLDEVIDKIDRLVTAMEPLITQAETLINLIDRMPGNGPAQSQMRNEMFGASETLMSGHPLKAHRQFYGALRDEIWRELMEFRRRGNEFVGNLLD